MSNVIFWILILFVLTGENCISQSSSNNNVTVVGEIRYGNNEKFRFREAVKITLQEKKYTSDSTLFFCVKNISPKEKYDKYPGTEIVFEMPFYLFNRATTGLNKKVKVNSIFYYPMINSSKTTKSNLLMELDFRGMEVYNSLSVKLENPIYLNAPERLTITMMIADINEDLVAKSDSGFASVVKILDKKFDQYYNKKEIGFETLMKFYSLLVYTEKYIHRGSFFISEGKKLDGIIKSLTAQLAASRSKDSTTVKSLTYPDNPSNNDLLTELTASIEVYQEYISVYQRIKDYNSRIKLILFLKTR